MRLKVAVWPPNSAATRSNWKKPTRPQLTAPTITRSNAIQWSGFMLSSLSGIGIHRMLKTGRMDVHPPHASSSQPRRSPRRREEHGVDDVDHAVAGLDVGRGDLRVVDHHDRLALDGIGRVELHGVGRHHLAL